MMDSASEQGRERYAGGHTHNSPMAVLMLGALGVVFGDIGTSPLYAFKSCLEAVGPLVSQQAMVLGILSLIFWALTIIVTVKYVSLVLSADNRGEGGVLALTALVVGEGKARHPVLLAALGLAGCAFFYGDGTITPAVSVLSAIEGMELISPTFKNAVVPLSVLVLLVLFAAQRHGTGRIGRLFGPVMLVWFVTIGVLGILQIVHHPEVLWAINPIHVVYVFREHPLIAMTLLSSVFLAVTGGEALYADLGHFGARPIRLVWYGLAWPCLVLNYFGQGALLLSDPSALQNPFYRMVPESLLIPGVMLATAATIIASQAVISGVFSMTQQALQLGFLPRMKVLQTSAQAIGQIYVPAVNAALCAATVGLVLAFQTSVSLAGAYGIAVVCTMFITAILMDVLLAGRRTDSKKSRWLLIVALPMVFLDGLFLVSNMDKIPQGGWFPLVCALFVFVIMRTWMRGRTIFTEQMRRQERTLENFLEELRVTPPQAVAGTAVFLSSSTEGVARTLTRNVRSNGVLHDHTVLMSVVTERIPRVPRGGRLKVRRLADHIWRVEAHIGFMEQADVPRFLREAERVGLDFRTENATYFLGRDDVVVSTPRGMATWRKHLFLFMTKNAEFAGSHFGIPPERIIELGGQVAI
jgi:KUP system potassium uptake protein